MSGWSQLWVARRLAVKIGWPYQRPGMERAAPYTDPTARYLARVEMIASDLELEESRRPTGRMVRGDARSSAVWQRATGNSSTYVLVRRPI